MPFSIKSLTAADHNQWLPLWRENSLHKIDDATTAQTWARLMSEDNTIGGFGAFLGDSAQSTVDSKDGKNCTLSTNHCELVGIIHYVLHHTTGDIAPACYMQDVYVTPSHRKKGIGSALVKHLAARAEEEGWARLYWFADNSSAEAQGLYKSLGVKLNFSMHVWPLSKNLSA